MEERSEVKKSILKEKRKEIVNKVRQSNSFFEMKTITKEFFQLSLEEQLLFGMEDTEIQKCTNRLNDAFWEDVIVEAQIEKTAIYTQCSIEEEIFIPEKLLFLIEGRHHGLIQRKLDDTWKEEDLNKAKKQIDREIWDKMYPVLMFYLDDLTEYSLGELQDFDFLFFSTLFLGENSDYDGKTIIQAFSLEMKRSIRMNAPLEIKKDFAKKMDKFRELCLADKKREEVYDKFVDIIEEYKTNSSKKRLGVSVKSLDLECMQELMLEAEENESVNKPWVVYTVNLFTCWIDYLLYVKDDNLDKLDYTGIALAWEAHTILHPKYDKYKCFSFIRRFLNHQFWKQADKLKKKIKKIYNLLEIVDEIDFEVYDRIYSEFAKCEKFGTKRDLCEFCIQRF